jgi:hypothetical protein
MPNEPRLPSYVRRCSETLIKVEENGRKATFCLPAKGRVFLVTVDGGMIVSGERADYIVAHTETVDVIGELKGSDIGKAVSQILATRPRWAHHEFAERMHAALIVRGKGMHPKDTTRVERWKKHFRARFQMKLVIETRNRDYEFEEFILPA